MNNRRTLLTLLFAWIFLLACAIPGLGGAAPSTPNAQLDAEQVDTMVAQTVDAAMAQTEAAAPLPTSTVAATAESSSSPTATDTPDSAIGSSLFPQTDGTIQYLDERGGFQFNVSPGWEPIRINEPEYYEAFQLPTATQPAVQRALLNIKSLDPYRFRLFVYDFQDGHMINGVITNISFVWDSKGSIALTSSTGIKDAAAKLSSSIPNLKIDSYTVSSTPTQIPIGVILSTIPGKTFEGTDVVLYQKQIYLNLTVGELIVSFTTNQDFKDATLPFFDTMISTLKLNP